MRVLQHPTLWIFLLLPNRLHIYCSTVYPLNLLIFRLLIDPDSWWTALHTRSSLRLHYTVLFTRTKGLLFTGTGQPKRIPTLFPEKTNDLKLYHNVLCIRYCLVSFSSAISRWCIERPHWGGQKNFLVSALATEQLSLLCIEDKSQKSGGERRPVGLCSLHSRKSLSSFLSRLYGY